ncbi:MAG: DUF2249 domain-containing protein [Dehalococcoidia bacterium]|nr:DUF2249 domain-containing protein [Dehalococcoidia bacterium]
MADPLEIDVRAVLPRERHPLIFATFDRLAPGEAFVLINDHEPKPLYYQFQAERAGEVQWEPLEDGPERWVVRIGKVKVAESDHVPATQRPTQPLRDEHRELLPHIERLRELGEAASETDGELFGRLDAAVDFLEHHLLVHAQAEERVLYPEVGALMGAELATATMSRDHVEVDRLTRQLAALRTPLAERLPAPADRASLQRLAYGLYALVTVHFAKEEEVYLPLLDSRLTPERARELFAALERAESEIREAQTP